MFYILAAALEHTPFAVHSNAAANGVIVVGVAVAIEESSILDSVELFAIAVSTAVVVVGAPDDADATAAVVGSAASAAAAASI